MKAPRLSWGPHQRAQQEADAAWAAVKATRKTKATAKAAKRKRRRKPKQFVGTYHEYIQSPQWAKKRRQAIETYGGRCAICSSTERIHVHHRHYRTLFHEAIGDLQLLCEGCHQNHHEADGKAADPMTREFLSLHL